MKGIKKIICRNVLSAGGIAIIILLTNIIMMISFISLNSSDRNMHEYIVEIGESFFYDDDNNELNITDEGKNHIDDYFKWAMLLDDDGNVIWSRSLPEDIPLNYTASDVASFSRWYLNDYPVNVWKSENGLLVLGSEKNSLWKHEIFFHRSLWKICSFILEFFL